MENGVQVPTVSVAILNHRRPALLSRVLSAISQLDYPSFEIVVVGDQDGIASYDLPDALADQVRYVHFAEPNICRARNLAVQASGGEIVAFIDDDAAPEPSWLTELVKPFGDPQVATVGGTVRASDGVSVEWQGGVFDRTGQEFPLTLTQEITLQSADEQRANGRYLGLRGVNSAFRRKALMQVGGFDEAIRYYLDETDMALRLADAGWSAAITRKAEVHHLLVPNASRGLLRKPGNQHEIGAGKAVFCAKHSSDQQDQALADFRTQRVAMLDPQMRLGIVRMADRRRVEQELEAGIRDGLSRSSCQPLATEAETPNFRPFQHQSDFPVLNIGIDTGWDPAVNRALILRGRALSAAGHRVSVFSFKSGPTPLRVNFRGGMWWHSGGTWTLPAWDEKPAISRRDRAKAERARVRQVRAMDVVLTPGKAAQPAGFIELPGCRRKVAMLAGKDFAGDADAVLSLLQSVADAPEATQSYAKRCMGPAKTRPLSAPAT